MNRTSIGWTDFSANPLKYRDGDGRSVWACEKVSPGCAHCYSADLAKRWNRGGDYNALEMAKLTPYLDDKELREMRKVQATSGRRCFVGDMTDLFGDWVSDDLLNHLYSETLERRTDVTWQLLTKRSDRLCEYLAWRYGDGRIPSRHIHHGVSVENCDNIERLDDLRLVKSAVRFVSFEPLLEHLGDIAPWLDAIDWAIIGGESGPRFRPCDRAWIADLVVQLHAANIPVFVKQGAHRLPGQPTGDAWLDSLKQFPTRAGDGARG